MNPLSSRLAALRRRLWLVVGVRALCWLAAMALGTAVAAGLLDWRLPGHLPGLVRAAVLVGALTGLGYVFCRHLFAPLSARADDLALALRVEAVYPALNDSLASAVQFLRVPEGSEAGGSAELRHSAVEQALRQAEGYDFRRVVDGRGMRSAGLSLAGAGALAVGLALAYPALAWTALARLADPFGRHDWPRQTRLEVRDYRPRVARGDAYEIDALVSGVVPESAELLIEGVSFTRQSHPVAGGRLHARLERVESAFRFQIRANDAVSAVYPVEVVPPPVLVPLEGRPSPWVRVRYPAYTGLGEQDLPDGSGGVEAVAGTRVWLTAATDRPIARAWIEYQPEPAAVGPAAYLGVLGAAHPSGVWGLTAAGREVLTPVPVRVEGDGRVLRAEFLPRVAGAYVLRFEDETGLVGSRVFDLRLFADPAPSVNLERPSRSRDDLDRLPGADIPLRVVAEDKDFGLRSVFLEYWCRADEARRRMALAEAVAAGPAPRAAQRLEVDRRLSLEGFRHADGSPLREGDVLTLQAAADDFDDVTVDKQPGRSHEVEIRIVSRSRVEAELNRAQARVQQDLLRARKAQQEAQELVIGPEQRWKNTGRLDGKDLDRLRQAEELQQQVRARVGDEREGLRAEVARILEAVRDNHLPDSGARQRMATVQGELERLAREELGQIEPRLTEARRSSGTEPDRRRPAPGKPGPLSEARKHQDEVEKTLNGLLKQLEPFSNLQEVQGEARTLRQEQQQLREQTEGLRKDLLGRRAEGLDAEQKSALARLAELQSRLAERAEQLLGKMERSGEGRPERAPEAAAALKQAAEQGRQEDVTGRMKAAAEGLQQNRLGNAGREQEKSLAGLERMVSALEEQRERELDRLRKGLKGAGERLDELTRRQEGLRKKAREAAGFTDSKKHEQALRQLAREQEQLRQEVQEAVRELSRMRGESAGRALSGAAARMQEAGERMQRGEDPAEPHEEALDRLQEAQRRLRQARAEVEEELARERLAKVADQIKLLKERQDAARAEGERLDGRARQARGWTRPLLSSLSDLAEGQRGLGQETENLAKERLAGAKPFARVVRGAADAMKGAAEALEGRLGELKNQPEALDDNGEVAGLQDEAARRLGQVLEALKPENAAKRQPAGDGGGGEGAGRPKGDPDAISVVAQYKLVRDIQKEVNDRTAAFGKKHPDLGRLSEKERRELEAIHKVQQEAAELFGLIQGADEGGEGSGTKGQGPGGGDGGGVYSRPVVLTASHSLLDTQDQPPVRLKKKPKKPAEPPPEDKPEPEPERKPDGPLKPRAPKEKAEDEKPALPVDVGKEVKDRLEKISRLMHEAEERLARKDPGEETRQVQRDILANFDALAELAKQQQQQQDAQPQPQRQPQGGRQDKGQKQPAGSQPQVSRERSERAGRRRGGGQPAPANRERTGGVMPKPNGVAEKKRSGMKPGTGNKADDGREPDKMAETFKDVWGQLPETLRQEMDQYAREQFMAKYSELLKQYYSTIAEKGRRKGP